MKKCLFVSTLILLIFLLGPNQNLQAQNYYKSKEAPTNELVEKNFKISGKFIGAKENSDGSINYYFTDGTNIFLTVLVKLDTNIWIFTQNNGNLGILEKK